MRSVPAIEVEALTKRFGHFTAVDRLSFEVHSGEIFGFLGPNGAGKSTTIRMLCGILPPTSGKGRVGGWDIEREGDRIKQHIGYMSQQFSLYPDLTVEENIMFYGGIYGLSNRELARRRQEILEIAGLTDQARRMTGQLSAGWKQRLALGCAILHRPPILFLDEPTSGVDPMSRRQFWDLIYAVADEGATVLVTTHYMDEAEHCDRLALIYRGHLIAYDTPEQLKRDYPAQLLTVACDPLILGLQFLESRPEILEVALFGAALHVTVQDAAWALQHLEPLLEAAGVHVHRIASIQPSLEDVFVALIEREEAR